MIVGKCGLNLNIQKHPQQIRTPSAADTKFPNHLTDRKIRFFTTIKRFLCHTTRAGIQIQARHKLLRQLDIFFSHSPFRFAQVPHHRKGGLQEKLLPSQAFAKKRRTDTTHFIDFFIRKMPQHRAENCAPKATITIAQNKADNFPDKIHDYSLFNMKPAYSTLFLVEAV